MKLIIFCTDQSDGFDSPTTDSRGSVLVFDSWKTVVEHQCELPDCLSTVKEWMPDREWCKDVQRRLPWAREVQGMRDGEVRER